MQIHRIIFTLLILGSSFLSFSQTRTGGTIGANYSNNIFILDFAPEIDYNVIAELKLGVSPFVMFANNTVTANKLFLYGIRTYGEYTISENIFLHAEYEYSKSWSNEGFGPTVHALPLGGGYETELTNNTVAYILVLYDVLHKDGISYRTNPIIRAGIRYSL